MERSRHVTGARWQEFADAAPGLAARMQEALLRNKHMTMATLRRNGSPRISGTEIELSDGDLFVGMGPESRKAHDLQRDPRVAIHGPTSEPPEDPRGWLGEAKVSGRAVTVPVEGYLRFRIEIEEAVFTRLNEAGDRLLVEAWHPERGVEVWERE
jgi:hypothetical protein